MREIHLKPLSQEYPKITPTKDGSTTLYSSRFSQHYHNPNGAVAESRHIFFETPGLPKFLNHHEKITVFETGFGTGLNLLLLLDYIRQSTKIPLVTYYSVEAYPLDSNTAAQFDFGDNPHLNISKSTLIKIFDGLKPGLNTLNVADKFTLHLFNGFFDDFFYGNFIRESEKMDFVIHDPFSPGVNPDLWTPEVFRKLAAISKIDVVLTTYCAATSARAAMAVGGWYVARAQGALGKREMTVASLNPEKLDAFKRVNEKKLSIRYENGDFS